MMNSKECGRMRSLHNLNEVSRNLSGVTGKNLSQDRRSQGQDLNKVPPEYEAEVSSTRRRSVNDKPLVT
jgi:hypothetical protein